MGLFTSFDINASGMTAQRFRMDTISQNVANVNTTRTEDGTPYVRKVVTFEERGDNNLSFKRILGRATGEYKGHGVRVDGIYEDKNAEMKLVYDPSHPDANDEGYVLYPNVNMITEMTNLIDASRGFEANATAFAASKAIAQKGLEMGK